MNILTGLQWLVNGAQPGDCLVVLFCGYGAQHPQSPGSDAHEAYIVPSDFAADLPADFFQQDPLANSSPTNASTAIVNAGTKEKGYRLVSLLELNRVVAQLPARCSLTMVLDCSYPLVPGVNPTQNLPSTFPRVERGRVDYKKLHDFVSRPRFLELPPLPMHP